MNGDYTDRRTGEVIDTSTTEGLRRALEAQQADINALLDDVHDLTDAVTGLADQLGSRAPHGSGGAAKCPCWQDLSPEDAEALMKELAEWVAWLRARYPIAEQLPPCWAQHSELVEELTALHAAWSAAYRDPDAQPTAPADFHDRWLPGVLGRVKTWGVHCGTDHHGRAGGVYADDQCLAARRA